MPHNDDHNHSDEPLSLNSITDDIDSLGDPIKMPLLSRCAKCAGAAVPGTTLCMEHDGKPRLRRGR